MILLCAHSDTVIPHSPPVLKNGLYTGLLDNALGVMCANAVLYRNHSLLELTKKGKLGVYQSVDEEFGLDTDQWIDRPDFALVVDVVAGKKYEHLDAAIENISVKDKGFAKDLEGFLQSEGYAVKTKDFTGESLDEDEAWMWRSLEVPTMSVLLPIHTPVEGGLSWHRKDCTCRVEKVEQFLNVLTRVLCYVTEDYA